MSWLGTEAVSDVVMKRATDAREVQQFVAGEAQASRRAAAERRLRDDGAERRTMQRVAKLPEDLRCPQCGRVVLSTRSWVTRALYAVCNRCWRRRKYASQPELFKPKLTAHQVVRGTSLVVWRESLGIGVKELANRLGYTAQYVRQLERTVVPAHIAAHIPLEHHRSVSGAALFDCRSLREARAGVGVARFARAMCVSAEWVRQREQGRLAHATHVEWIRQALAYFAQTT